MLSVGLLQIQRRALVRVVPDPAPRRECPSLLERDDARCPLDVVLGHDPRISSSGGSGAVTHISASSASRCDTLR